MDGIRFDGFAKTLATATTPRQGLLRLAAGAGLVAALGVAEPAEAARRNRRCRRNGSPCLTGGTGNCCSGRCRPLGRRGIGRCRVRPAAKGCTIRDDSCSSDTVGCPQDNDGLCFTLNNGQPFCATRATCFNCSDDADCNRRFRRSGGRCIDCDNCDRQGRVCIFA